MSNTKEPVNCKKVIERFSVSAIARTILDASIENQKASVYVFLNDDLFSNLCYAAEIDREIVKVEILMRLGKKESWSPFQQFLAKYMKFVFNNQLFDNLMSKYIEFMWDNPELKEASFLEIKSDLNALGFDIVKDRKVGYKIKDNSK